MESEGVTTKTIRDINEDIYQKIRGKCTELKLNMGTVTTEAFKLWLEKG